MPLRLFRGCAVTWGPSGTTLHALDRRTCQPTSVPSLNGTTLVDAVCVGDAFVVVARDQDGWLRVSQAAGARRVERTDSASAELLVLPSGLTVIGVDDGLRLLGGPAEALVPDSLPEGAFVHRGRPAAVDGRAVHAYTTR